MGILFVFSGQIFLLMIAYGIEFFKNKFFVLDMFVVGGALILELGFHVSEGALFVVLLSWRFIRIVHGFVSTIEISHHKFTHGSANISAKEHEKQFSMVEGILIKLDALDVFDEKSENSNDTADMRNVKEQLNELRAYMRALMEKTSHQLHKDHEKHLNVLERKLSKSIGAVEGAISHSIGAVKEGGRKLLV